MDAAYSQGFSRDDEDLMYVVDEEYDDDIEYTRLSDWMGGVELYGDNDY
jgi:hypothetical protein